MNSVKSVISTLGHEALAVHSFLLLPSLPQFLGIREGMFHLARASIHTLRNPSTGCPDQPKPKKVYTVVCLSQFGSAMSIHAPEETTLGQIFHDTHAVQLVVFKDAV